MRSTALLLGLMSACEPEIETPTTAETTLVQVAAPAPSIPTQDLSCTTGNPFFSAYAAPFGEIQVDSIPREGYIMCSDDPCCTRSNEPAALAAMAACDDERTAKENKENRDPILERLAGRFQKEAERQVQAVQDAGGYCKLPLKVAPSTCYSEEGFYPEECPDDRLGNKLTDLAVQRDERLEKLYPVSDFGWRERGLSPWTVELGRSDCEAVKLDPEASYLDESAQKFNSLCAESEGGLLNDELDQNPYAIHQVLVERGRAVMAELLPIERDQAQDAWVIACSPESDYEALTPLEYEQFLGSIFPMQDPDGYETAWICPADGMTVKSLYGGFDRDECGRVTECVTDPNDVHGIKQVVKLPD